MSQRTVGGKYTLEREIARGGMGAVWVAFDLRLRRRVALKLMRPDHTNYATLRGRFEREAMAIAQLQNPHVIQVYDYGIDEDCPYIVMELLEGEDLEARLLRQGRWPLATVVSVATQIAKALGAAHAAGIIHRDLKPANIFLARTDSEEVVKILDFGVAAMVSALAGDDLRSTRAGSLLGTPNYMAPEQVRGARNVDQRADLWSLGVILYRMLTAEFPFSGDALGDLIVKICTDPVAPPSTLVPELGVEVDAFFERALARDPAQRFQSARDMANAFAALAGGARPSIAKILVVDDEPDVALLIKQRFRQHIRKAIYEFVFATDGENALEQLRRHPDIDVALTDINMPGMDGLTFLGHVGEVNPILKAIIVSAYSDMNNIRQAMNRGAFDFLVKPIDFKDLEITIDKTLKHVRELRKTIQSTEENSILRMFVNNGIVERILPMMRASGLIASETIDATVAFIDVHNFTATTEDMSAETVIRKLNANFEVIVPEVTSRGGMVDKFVGHAVMAVFRGADHATRAIESCIALRSQLQTMAVRAGPDSPYGYGVSIGVESGQMIWGSIGSKAFLRLDCTVVGEVVHSAVRLQSVATKGQILIGESFHQALMAAFHCEAIGFKQLPGRAEPVLVYNVLHPISPSTVDREAETVATPGQSIDWPGEPVH